MADERKYIDKAAEVLLRLVCERYPAKDLEQLLDEEMQRRRHE